MISDSAIPSSIGPHQAHGFREGGVLAAAAFAFGRWVDALPLERPAPAIAALLWLAFAPQAAAETACSAPEPVCAARTAVFAVSAFDPAASAVRVAPDLLVTNRHVTADNETAAVRLPDGNTIVAKVVPSGYPGDLVLLRSPDLPPGPVPKIGASAAELLYPIGADPRTGEARVLKPGHLVHAPAASKPLARLHHDAESGPGDSGGALVDAEGALVAVVTSGGEGHNEAIPAAEIARLRALSGPDQAAVHAALGQAYRRCILRLEATGDPQLSDSGAQALEEACGASGNRQLFDLAAQALGRAGRLEASAQLFERSLEQDPNAVNARLGLVVTLLIARDHAAAVPHLERLLDELPDDPMVLRFAIQAGKWGGAPALAERAYELLLLHDPETAEAARRFLDAELPAPAPAQ